ncbi:NTP transferase domain-containing protein [Amphiplicatus metriothermophilus]|uniref:CMP-2-keto-3-deoxyoctulosonic acid synthetase n=1 Tax=Amphiplicatus metriothermophilus TaxID=1519374 RepID=A0A239PTQ0_9PROT|nr:NTP transferase domain-containing protein [Amphiplicatus metriothermophilus]MBB5519233.1 CTP:molybdopterin cytidylyltransferase MocA [Amphiplicatus metriothermophilus]SNT73302.1 CMP-2-keto-3-deoxyoctulosonic acid synthetase [Amphiplicatus metriothermophilus]
MKGRARPLNALVLAGRRRGDDPLAEAAGGAHKAFIDIAGKPMIVRVLESLAATPGLEEILLAAPDDVRAQLAARLDAGLAARIRHLPAEDSPAASALAALDASAPDAELLLAASDHPLLTPAMIEEFLAGARRDSVDAAAACVTRETMEAAYPGAPRTFVRLRNFSFSGANLFWFRGARARPLVAFWRRIEAERKNPARMARIIGPGAGLLYLAGLLTKERALAMIEARTGVRAALVPLSVAEAAIDVDKPADLDLVRRIFARRARE